MSPRERVRHLIDILHAERDHLDTLLELARRVQSALRLDSPHELTEALEAQAACLDALRAMEREREGEVSALAEGWSLESGAKASLAQLLAHLDPEEAEELRRLGASCKDVALRLSRIQRVNALIAEKSLVCMEGLGRALVEAVLQAPEYGPAGRHPAAVAPPCRLDRRA